MITFEQELSADEWIEVLRGKGMIAFDLVMASDANVFLSDGDATPSVSAVGNAVASWGRDWDFHAAGLVAGVQRIWVKGSGSIVGVR